MDLDARLETRAKDIGQRNFCFEIRDNWTVVGVLSRIKLFGNLSSWKGKRSNRYLIFLETRNNNNPRFESLREIFSTKGV